MTMKVRIIMEQRDTRFDDLLIAKCVWCGFPGGEGRPPWRLRDIAGIEAVGMWQPLDLHEWLLKRGANAPEEVTFCYTNLVVAHHACHMAHGNTVAFRNVCYGHKTMLGYDIIAWLNEIQASGQLVSRPEL